MAKKQAKKNEVTITPIVGESPARRLHVQQAYYRHARYFEVAAAVVQETKNDPRFPKDFVHDVPIVVLHSFAVEIYLKCLLQIEDKLATGHLFDELFKALAPDHRSRIEKKFAKATDPWKLGQTAFDILKRSGNAFVEWRYLNEDNPKNFSIYSAVLVLPDIKTIIWEDVPSLKTILP